MRPIPPFRGQDSCREENSQLSQNNVTALRRESRYQLVEELGGRSSSAVPQAFSFLPNVNSNTPPSSQKSWVIQFFV